MWMNYINGVNVIKMTHYDTKSLIEMVSGFQKRKAGHLWIRISILILILFSSCLKQLYRRWKKLLCDWKYFGHFKVSWTSSVQMMSPAICLERIMFSLIMIHCMKGFIPWKKVVYLFSKLLFFIGSLKESTSIAVMIWIFF